MRYVTLFILIFSSLLCVPPILSAENGEGPDYNYTLNPAEEKNLHYMIETLGGGRYFSLLGKQGSLQRSGDAISHIHPLRVFAYIFTDSELNGAIRTMHRKVWRRFRNDWAESLLSAQNEGHLTQEHLRLFAEEVRVDFKRLEAYYKQKGWEDFLDYLVDEAPSARSTPPENTE